MNPCLKTLAVLGSFCLSAFAAVGQDPTDDEWNVALTLPARKRTYPGFGFWAPAQRDSVCRAFVSEKALKHAFKSLYRDSTGQHMYKLAIRFDIPAGEQQPFAVYPCPRLDSVTYRQLSYFYSRDKNGVYCDLTGVLLFGGFNQLGDADPSSFKAFNCRTLAVDQNRVYLNGRGIAGLSPKGLRAYAPGGHTYDNDFDSELYLVTRQAVYRVGDDTVTPLRGRFRPPRGYRQVSLKRAPLD